MLILRGGGGGGSCERIVYVDTLWGGGVGFGRMVYVHTFLDGQPLAAIFP